MATAQSSPAAAPDVKTPSAPDRPEVNLIAGLAFGGVALLAVGASEYKGGLAILAVVMLLVGPVAYGGLVFSMKQVSAVLTMNPKVPGAEAEAAMAEAKCASPIAAASSSPATLRKRTCSSTASTAAAPEVSAAKSAGKGGKDGEQLKEPAFNTWSLALDPVALAEQAVQCAKKAWAGTPTPTEVVAGACDLWTWLSTPRWKPFPWNWLPDPVAFAIGVSLIAFMAPIFAMELIVVVPLMIVLKKIWRHEWMALPRAGIPEAVRSISRPLARCMMRDPRNHSYLPWMALCGTCIPALFFWAMRRYAVHGLEISTLCIYHLIRVGPRFQFFAHIHTLAHKEGHAHKGFFKGPFQFLNCLVEWWIAPFYGVVPWNYYIAHMKIHHRWHNDVDDVHTNLDLDRTNPLSFFLYTPRFALYWSGLSPIALFVQRKEWVILQKLVAGMVAYYGVAAVMFWWSPTFCFVYWIFPHLEGGILLCAISYLWHAFVEESDPGNQYVNSVTILEGHDNVWNEDYHVVHHHAPNTHWTDAPAHFEKHREQYAAVNATIFRDTEEGKLLQWMFERNWDAMAEHFVDLNGKLTYEEKRALIVRRLSVRVGAEGRDGKRTEWASTSSIREWEE